MLLAVFGNSSHSLATRLIYGILAGLAIAIATSIGGGICFVHDRYRDAMPPTTLNQSLILFAGAGVVLAIMMSLLKFLSQQPKQLPMSASS